MIVLKKYRLKALPAFMLLTLSTMVLGMLSACKSNIPVTPSNGIITQINIVNLSPDMGDLYFWVDNANQNLLATTNQNGRIKPYIYGIPSGYIAVNNTAVPFELRALEGTRYFNYEKPLTFNNRYTVFTTGLVADKTQDYIFATDSDSAPTLGRGKVRFINASARAINLDLTANGTIAFKNLGFKGKSDYVEMPAGIYDFKILTTGTTDALADLPKITIQDGKLYTIYSKGILGRTDSAAIGMDYIINR